MAYIVFAILILVVLLGGIALPAHLAYTRHKHARFWVNILPIMPVSFFASMLEAVYLRNLSTTLWFVGFSLAWAVFFFIAVFLLVAYHKLVYGKAMQMD